jgi:hypothetical protein
MVADIINLGLCIVNQDISKELDKIFLEQLQDTPSSGEESGISHTQYVELLGTMAKIVHMMDNAERELWEFKSTRCSKCACTCASTINNSEPAPDHVTSSGMQYVSDDTSGGGTYGININSTHMITELLLHGNANLCLNDNISLFKLVQTYITNTKRF